MELNLKYLIVRIRGKRILFTITAEEAVPLLERIQLGIGASRITEISPRGLERSLERIERWIVTTKPVDSETLSRLICKAHLSGVQIGALDSFLLEELDPVVPANSPQLIHLLARHGVHQGVGLKLYTQVKYLLEPLIAFVFFLLLSPILLAVAIAVKLSSPGPVIYSQKRVGFHDRVFRIYKFRSMRHNAENGKAAWALASKNDPSLTPIGAFLRSSHLDELPQLWNIIRGDLSFIGPRPERPEFVRELSEQFPLFKLRPLLKPGITGWAQIKQGYANTIEDSRKKLELDLFYLVKHSPKLDLKICLMTFAVLVSGGTEEIKRNLSKSVKVNP